MKCCVQPKISIIIPVFNTEKYLPRCIDSVLSQNFYHYELIIINDGSIDNSFRIMKEYANVDNRILIIDKVNEGVTIARKLGVERASGEWICFLDSDDELPENAIKALYGKTNETIDMVIGSYKHTNDKNILYKKYYSIEIEDKRYIKELIKGKIHVAPWGRLIRKSIFEFFTFDIPSSITKGQDFIMNVRLGQKCHKIVLLPDIVYHYVWRANSACSKKYDKKYEKFFDKILLQSILPENENIRKTVIFFQYYRRIRFKLFKFIFKLKCKDTTD